MADAWDETYQYAYQSAGAGKGTISCATKKQTSPAEIYWRYDTGDYSWSEAPVLVTMIGGADNACHTWMDSDGSVLVSNGKRVWRSEEYGKAGSWVLLPEN